MATPLHVFDFNIYNIIYIYIIIIIRIIRIRIIITIIIMTIYVQLCTCIHCFSSCMSSRHIKTIQIETLDHSEALHFPLTWPYSSFCERPSTPGLPTVFIYRCSRISIDFSTGHCIIRIISQWANEFCTSKTPAAALFPKYIRLIKIHV
jgi:hypothetical protein